LFLHARNNVDTLHIWLYFAGNIAKIRSCNGGFKHLRKRCGADERMGGLSLGSVTG